MNYKILLIFSAGMISAFFIGFLINSFESEKQFEITSDKELLLALDQLRENFKDAEIRLTVDHILFLVDQNVKEYYIIEPNQMIETTYSTNENYDDIEKDYLFYDNGTRHLVEKHDNGTILKEIIIHDNHKNPAMVLILEDLEK